MALATLFTGCDDKIEPLDIKDPSIENQDPEKYQSYLEDLRNYKNSSHKVVIGWFDNSEKTPVSQAQHIHSTPDSIDYLVLTSPSDITVDEIYEMNELIEYKSTKFLYEISYDDIRLAYQEEEKAFEEDPDNEGKSFRSLNDYLVDTLELKLSYADKFGFDGIIMSFTGQETNYMSDDEKKEYISLCNDFIGIAQDWYARHEGKTLLLMGKPQFVIDKSVFDIASYILVPCQSTVGESGLTYNVTKAADEGVPTDKFVPVVTCTSLDATDTKTGYWSDGSTAVVGTAYWVASTHSSFTIAGMGIENISNDYYHSDFTYPNVRKAISIINPTVKN